MKIRTTYKRNPVFFACTDVIRTVTIWDDSMWRSGLATIDLMHTIFLFLHAL